MAADDSHLTRSQQAAAATPGAARIAARRAALRDRWPRGWGEMIDAWAGEGPDACWLMYSANYLFRTGGVRWAVDPLTLGHKVPEAHAVDPSPLAGLSFVLMTHHHSDHVDPALLARLARTDVRWVVPDHMRPVARAAGVDRRRWIDASPGWTIEIEGVRVTPFEGMHLEYPGHRWGAGEPVAGIASTGYFVEAGGRRLMLPGDTRTYDAAPLAAWAGADTVFAHVWLGRGAAMDDPPPLTGAFCDFVAGLSPRRRVVLAHLWQVARGPGDYWDERHADRVASALSTRLTDVEIRVPDFWQTLTL